MARRKRQGRTQIDRAGVAQLTAASSATVGLWYRDRPRTGFPDVAEVGPHGRQWYWLHEVRAFWTRHQAGRAATFTPVNRAGHPDDLVGAPEAAQILGYRHRRSLPKLLLDNPDEVERLPSGRLRRRWRRATVWNFADTRHLRHSTGHPPGTTGARQRRRYGDDPRLPAAVALLADARRRGEPMRGLGATFAAQLGIHPRTARRLLAAARTVDISQRVQTASARTSSRAGAVRSRSNHPGQVGAYPVDTHQHQDPRPSGAAIHTPRDPDMTSERYECGDRVEPVYTADPDTRTPGCDQATVAP